MASKEPPTLTAAFERPLTRLSTEAVRRLDTPLMVELLACAHYGKLDLFDERLRRYTTRTPQPAFADVLREMKQTTPDDATIRNGMHFFRSVVEARPTDPAVAEKIQRHFGMLLRQMPDAETQIDQYFTEQRECINLGRNSVWRKRHSDHLPDDTLSTFCLYKKINPRTSLISSDLSGAIFKDDGVFFEGANFRAADMRGAEFHPSSSIKGARLEGADLSGAKGLTNQRLAGCYINEKTKLPGNVNRAKIMALHAALDMPPAPDFTALEMRWMPKAKASAAHTHQPSAF